MSGLNFPIKKLRYASEMRPEELPPMVGKGRILMAYDDITAGIPKGEGEEEKPSVGQRPETTQEK